MLSEEIIKTIKLYQTMPIHEVALKLSGKNLPTKFLLEQIEGRQKSKIKLNSWSNNEQIIFPEKLNLEQCSSELTAIYKASVLDSINSVLDLTGGFGVDSYYFAQNANKVIYVEQNKDLVGIVKQNFEVLGAENISVICDNCLEMLKNTDEIFSLIYIDPARRSENNQKIFNLADCQPNVIELLPNLFTKAAIVMIKASPMFDIDFAINQLKNVFEVHIISVGNECKEVIYLLKNIDSGHISIKTINILLSKANQIFDFEKAEEQVTEVQYSNPLKYLYEPNASVMKSGAFKLVANKFHLYKIAPNTHIYTSYECVQNFPGKIFEITGVYNYKAPELFGKKHNVVCRNFTYSPEEIKKTMKIKDHTSNFIFAMRNMHEKLILVSCIIIN